MALDPGSLAGNLTAFFQSGNPPTPQVAAQKLANIYATYAQGAMAGVALPVFTGAEKAVLQNMLLAAIAVPQAGLPATIAAAWGAGLLAFWNTPPVVFAGVGVAGAVTVAAGCMSCVPALTLIYLNAFNTPSTAAAQMAIALDIATRTVMVAVAPPPGVVVPLL